MFISEEDKKKLNHAFGDLVLHNNIISWKLKATSYFDNIKEQFFWTTCSDDCDLNNQKYLLSYEYNIEITLPLWKNDFIVVKEVDWHIQQIAIQNAVKLEDMHINKNNSLCVCWPLQQQEYIKQWLTLEIIMCEIVTWFFYAQKFFELYSERPWWELAHGEDWLYQEVAWLLWVSVTEIVEKKYIKGLIMRGKKPKGHHPCLCWSKKRRRKCHPELFHKLWHSMCL